MNYKSRFFVPVILVMMLAAMVVWSLTPEVANAASLVVNTTDDVVNNLDGKCSLREAIIAANTNSISGIVVGECPAGSDTETDTITLADGSTYLLSIAGVDEDAAATGDLDIIDNTAETDIRLVADNNGTATISGNSIDRVLNIFDAAVEIENLTLTEGDATPSGFDDGGIVLNIDGILTMQGGVLSRGLATSGGGIYSYNSGGNGGKVFLNGTQVILNVAQNIGGGILSAGSTAHLGLDDAIVRANTAALDAAGIALAGGTANFIDSAVSLNTADDDGGGIVAQTTVITMTNMQVEGNKALSGSGGGLYLDAASADDLSLSDSIFSNNSAGDEGGAIFVILDASTLIIDKTDFIQNTSGGRGGAISSARVKVYGGTFDQNSAGGDGGAIFGSPTVSVFGVTFIENSANKGGAIRSQFLVGDHSVFDDNEATSDGGAVYLTNRIVEISDMTFYQNSAGQNGGAVYQTAPDFDLDSVPYIINSVFHLNMADADGGALWTNTPIGLQLANTTISMNAAAGNGGGIFLASTGLLTATNVTMNSNFAGLSGTAIFKEGEMWLQNSIIGPHNATDCVKVATPFISLGNNLSASDTCDFTQPSDLVNTDPLLDATQNNGGPTWTAALLLGSPALNAGNDATCAGDLVNSVDQRGILRASPCDIGAYEQAWALYLPMMVK